MSCQTCGHPSEEVDGVQVPQGHNLGCEESWKVADRGRYAIATNADVCEHGDCMKPKKSWSGRGAKPKYCADGHK